jgi:hypothetical protein
MKQHMIGYSRLNPGQFADGEKNLELVFQKIFKRTILMRSFNLLLYGCVPRYYTKGKKISLLSLKKVTVCLD